MLSAVGMGPHNTLWGMGLTVAHNPIGYYVLKSYIYLVSVILSQIDTWDLRAWVKASFPWSLDRILASGTLRNCA